MSLSNTTLLILIICLCICSAYTQEPSYKNYDINDGLTSSTVYRINQDKNGLIWFATSQGLCSFDGYDFRPVISESSGNLEMINMTIDSSGRIWHFNLLGELFYLEDGIVHSFMDPAVSNYGIEEIAVLQDKLVVIYQKGGESIITGYDLSDSNYRAFYSKNNISFPSLSTYEDSIRISYHDNTKALFKVESIGITGKLKASSFKMAARKTAGALNENYILSINKNQDSIFLHSNNRIIDKQKIDFQFKRLVTIGSDTYILTHNGIRGLQVDEGIISVDNNILFSGLKVLSFFKDHEGNYWIGTANSGVYFVPNLQSILFNKSNSKLTSDKIRTLSASKLGSGLYLGLENGDVYSLKNHKDFQLIDKFGVEVNTIIEDNKNKDLWIASNKNLSRYSLINDSRSSINSTFKDIAIASNNRILSAQNNGNFIFDLKNRAVSTAIGERISSSRSYAVNVDSRGRFWVGDVTGLYVFHENEDNQYYKTDTLLKFNVSDIEFSNDSIAFVSTFEHGLFRFQNLEHVKQYNAEKLLSSNRISDIFIDDDLAYLSTDQGLNILHIKNDIVRFINKSDGIISENINKTVVADNSIWMATNKGLCKIPMRKESVNLNKHKVRINSVSFSNSDTTVLSNYNLEANNRNVSLSFSSSSYRLADHTSFYYRLNQLDTVWQKSNGNSVRFSQIPFGQSHFEVYAQDRNTNNKTAISTVTFNVDVPLKHRKWFQGLLLLVLMYIVSSIRSSFLKLKHKKEKERLINQRKMSGLKLTALQNHMNPHFISNAILNIQNLYDKGDSWAASLFTSKFAQLVRSSMHLSTLERISLEDEIIFLNKYIQLEQMRFDRQINTSIELDDDLILKKGSIMVPPLLIQPIIENAFKHAGLENKENAKMKIHFSNHENYLVCKVSDNGIGFDSNMKHGFKFEKKSTGLVTIEKRLKLNAEQLEFSSEAKDLISYTQKSEVNDWTIVTLYIYYKS